MRLKNRICNRRGEGYIDTALTVFIIAMLLAVMVNVFSLMIMREDLNLFAEELIEAMTASGRTGVETSARIAELKSETGLNPQISYEGTSYMSGSSEKVQLGKTMKVTVEVSMNMKGMGAFTMPVKLKATQSGLSKVYWK